MTVVSLTYGLSVEPNYVKSRFEVTLIIDLASASNRRIIRGISEFVHRNNRDWTLQMQANFDDLDLHLFDSGGDGVLAHPEDHRVIRHLKHLSVPIVGIGGHDKFYAVNPHISRVCIDNSAVALMGAKYLLQLGFRRFAFCSESSTKRVSAVRERGKVFASAIREAGFICEGFVSKCDPAKRWTEYQRELRDWLIKLKTPTALMACDDRRARHVLQACRAIGLRVPDDIAVLGVDDDELMCELSRPPLSSICPGAFRLGIEAAATLDRLMRQRQLPQKQKLLPPEKIVARQSTDITAIAEPDVADALSYIRNYACDRIRAKDVLLRSNMSRTTLDGKFQELVGRTIHAEIARVQIERAQNLLVTTNLPIKAVALRSGFSTVQYFVHSMRKFTSLTPGEFRKRAVMGSL